MLNQSNVKRKINKIIAIRNVLAEFKEAGNVRYQAFPKIEWVVVLIVGFAVIMSDTKRKREITGSMYGKNSLLMKSVTEPPDSTKRLS